MLQRTLRVPDDGGEHPLPPGLGSMTAYALGGGEYVVPMHRAEATWLRFSAPSWKPHALKVGIGGVDAISGEEFVPGALTADPQDYAVVPDQPWLEGINAGDGFVRQFVAVPLGEGKTVEAQLTGREREGGLALSVFAPRPGRFPDAPPPPDPRFAAPASPCACAGAAAAMGLGAGGRIRQELYADAYGIGTWEPEPAVTVRIDLVDALAFTAITRIPVAPPPVDAYAYTHAGAPWFDLLDPTRRDVEAAERLANVRSLADLERRIEAPLPIPEHQVIRLLRLAALAA